MVHRGKKGTLSKKAHDDRQWKIILRSGINLDGELLTPLPSEPDALSMQNVRLHTTWKERFC